MRRTKKEGINRVLYWQLWLSVFDSWSKLAVVESPSKPETTTDNTPEQATAPQEPEQKSTPAYAADDENCEFLKEYIMRHDELCKLAQSQLLANMNHDLRTPLNAVIGFAQIIESEIFGKINPQYIEYARHIQDSGYDLLEKIEDLIGKSAEAGKKAEPPVKARKPAKKLAMVD